MKGNATTAGGAGCLGLNYKYLNMHMRCSGHPPPPATPHSHHACRSSPPWSLPTRPWACGRAPSAAWAPRGSP